MGWWIELHNKCMSFLEYQQLQIDSCICSSYAQVKLTVVSSCRSMLIVRQQAEPRTDI
ncbi:hypothetical protein RchiOBHm_Chr7g0195011 [Rosa chinensis]|uniref:Uncharacterized protein n=1 Tax=Rosa chinensis TaxID=74649 RepID=A0A2P6P681_ROSCH|nr:hypothetical protein RchiOBHm_Chr7g0195011 [Rosa chinensis]